ncbi:MAG: haloacid dehalogenase-like hydrolase, partial [Phycisphaerales bacterium]|nr:haloacid dehalogenase-like hydrolase [Phycisphaerales bacterium]
SWNDGPSKTAITSFVTRVTKEGSPELVQPADRIATFDNDGTLWAEQPLYFQFVFMLDQVKAAAPQHPEWKDNPAFKALVAQDHKALAEMGHKPILELLAVANSGMTTEEYDKTIRDWLAKSRHPKFDRPYTALVYKPMQELLAYLRDNGFKTYIVSGGSIEFMRTWAQDAYGIPSEQIIGSQQEVKPEMKDGKPVLVREPKIAFIDDGPGKPVGIYRRFGRRPIAAFGNSDGDLQMLQYTTAGDGPRFALIVHHTDAEREFAYDRQSHIGKLDKALDEAAAKGWTVVDMKNDWRTIFPAPSISAASVERAQGAASGSVRSTSEAVESLVNNAALDLSLEFSDASINYGFLPAQDQPGDGAAEGQAAPAGGAQNEANNPLTPKITFNLHNYYTPHFYGLDGDEQSNQFLLRGVIPHKIGGPPQLFRFTLPIAYGPSLPPDTGYDTGLGDLILIDYFVFKGHGLEFGLGPVFVAPTATSDALGAGQWQIGASGLVVSPHKWGIVGGIVTFQQSFASNGGDSDRDDVTLLQFQPLAIYNLPKGFYLRSTAIWNFDLNNDTYFIPLGLGAGKVWQVGKTTVNVFVEPQYTVFHDDDGVAPQWQIFAGINFQF